MIGKTSCVPSYIYLSSAALLGDSVGLNKDIISRWYHEDMRKKGRQPGWDKDLALRGKTPYSPLCLGFGELLMSLPISVSTLNRVLLKGRSIKHGLSFQFVFKRG
jgi:hypothetical protein